MSKRNFSIYRASAGTGKTYTLVKNFLKLILSDSAAYRTILAITFTNKAAAEMKNRILNTLQKITENHDNTDADSIIDDLMADLKLSKEELQKKAQNALTNIIHDYSSFSISTIDSFTSKIVKTFSRELGFQPDFEIEIESAPFIEKAIDLIVAKAGTDSAITQVLADFVDKKLEDEKNFYIKKDLNEFGKQIWKENGINEQEKLKCIDIKHFIDVRKKITSEISILKNKIQTEARCAKEMIDTEGFSDKLYQKNTGIYGHFQKRAELSTLNSPNRHVNDTIYNNKWQKESDKKHYPIPASLTDTLKTAFFSIESNVSLYKIYLVILKELYAVSLLNIINQEVNKLYTETGKVVLAEFNKRISAIIKEEPIPYIYEKVGAKYEHFFIDEFQDTSDLQWNNISPLIQEALSKGGLSMIVGDGKQAIYRFRNGNVELFEHLSSVGNNDESLKTDPFYHQAITKSLSTNFRSEQNIVAFNNHLIDFAVNFVQKSEKKEVSSILKNVFYDQYLSANKKEEGFVKIKFLETEDENFNDLYLEEILSTIQEIIQKGYKLGDIAILCRTKKQLLSISNHLVTNNITISSEESLLISNSPEVNLLCALIRYLADKESVVDKLFITQWVLHQKEFQESHHEVLKFVKEANETEFQLFLKEEGYFIDLKQLSEIPFMDMISDLIIDFQLDISNTHINFFVDALMNSHNLEPLSIYNFQDWWSEKEEKLSLSVADTSGSIQMMTIHKSKGLEFPIVIFPVFKNDKKNYSEKIWIDPNKYFSSENIGLPATLISLEKDAVADTKFEELYLQEEEKKHLDLINLLYVTCTRAKKALYIFCKKQEKPSETVELTNIFNAFASARLNDRNEFIMGELLLNPIEQQKIKKTQVAQKEPFKFTQWHKKVSISHKKNITQHFFENEYTQYGNLIHTLLEKITTAEDIQSSVNQLIHSGFISQKEKNIYVDRLSQIIEHPLLKPCFSPTAIVLNENDILLPNSSSSFRPDRIAIIDNKTTIIDYKTGIEKDEHSSQIKKYADILTEMNYNIAHGYIVYIERDNVIVKEIDL